MHLKNFRLAVLSIFSAAILSACTPVVVSDPPTSPAPAQPEVVTTVSRPAATTRRTPQQAARNFITVIGRMEPAVERECVARRTTNINCDYQFVVDDRLELEPNAFQTLDNSGRPIIGFTVSLIAAAQNADELAFVVGHEASHHILNHLARKSGSATAGAVILGGLAAAAGADSSTISSIQQIGAQVGSRVYSKDWELQADYLGAIITMNAGYDPVTGAEFFRRMPDPGDRILGSHPSRAARMTQVQRAVADIRSGRVR
ncbi:M48 family metalloprotease [Paracoccus aerodenitrificans]|uniref:M48 family metalloprotease n=1 Tax=Paracoccus aerodenitrificans TaxID=3017781 RepID=UPI0022F12431|nr:M48 family metalloprotease [Paracoccus aerodenitrificans]WBU64415.1 M48 family metalloprotease [Paracoccus aerodenitrificans]